MPSAIRLNDQESLAEAISMGEANMQLEGFNPSQNALYRSLRDDVLAGKITFDEAIDAAVLSLSPAVNRSAA